MHFINKQQTKCSHPYLFIYFTLFGVAMATGLQVGVDRRNGFLLQQFDGQAGCQGKIDSELCGMRSFFLPDLNLKHNLSP